MNVRGYFARRSGTTVGGASASPSDHPSATTPSDADDGLALRPIGLVTNVAWMLDTTYLVVRSALLFHPLILLIYAARVQASLHGLVWDRWNRRLFEEAMFWIEPLARLILITVAVRAASRITTKGKVPRADMWGYVLFRLALTALVLRVAWPAPSMLPFIGGYNKFFESGPGAPVPNVLTSLLWATIDLAAPIAVGLGLLATPARAAPKRQEGTGR